MDRNILEQYFFDRDYAFIAGNDQYGDYFVYKNDDYIIGGFYLKEVWIAYSHTFESWKKSKLASFDYPVEEYQIANLDLVLSRFKIK